jgi:hypothetical protein
MKWLLLVALVAMPLLCQAQCTYNNVTPSTFASTFSTASGGSTICLTAGNYGTFSGASKSSMVTIQPDTANGGTQANVIFGGVNLVSASNISFANMTIGGGSVGNGSTAATHIHFSNIVFSGALCINTPTNENQDTLIDHGSFVNIGQSCTEGRLGITGNNVNHSVPNGIVITNTLFSGSGPSDGIQINGGAYGTVIGPGNTFTGILEGGCGSIHCDAIQFYGAVNTKITGNLFINDSDAIMSPDCNGSPMTVTNNVFVQDPSSATNEVIVAGGKGDVFDHNTFGSTHSSPRFGNPNNCGLNTNITLTDNILMGGITLTDGQSSSSFTENYSLIPGGGTGSNTISGSPTFVGGASPTTLAGFQLTSGSLGFGDGMSGTNIGILAVTGGLPPPSPPTNLLGLAK